MPYFLFHYLSTEIRAAYQCHFIHIGVVLTAPECTVKTYSQTDNLYYSEITEYCHCLIPSAVYKYVVIQLAM